MIGRILRFAKGTISFSAENGSPERLIARCGKEELVLFDISATETGISARCLLREFSRIEELAQEYGVTVKKEREKGLPRILRRHKLRFMLPCMLLIVLLLLLFSQSFLWTIDVRGNRILTDEAILSVLEEEGLTQMTFLPNADLRMVCEEVMLKLPQLSFITLNRYGSRVEAIVAERELAPQIRSDEPCDIVAAADGVIRAVEVYEGEETTGPGYAVQQGEILVHGHYQTKKGQEMLVHAEAKIIAEVFFEKTIFIDLDEVAKQETREVTKRRFFYCFGLKIPLSFPNEPEGNYEEEWTESPLTFFQKTFPIGITTCTKRYYTEIDKKTAKKNGEEILRRAFSQYEVQELSDCAILAREERFSSRQGILSMTVQYTAEKDIAKQAEVTMQEFTASPESS
ncbi:MAG: sporulation protein YqfD [Oscillospiraceae bacterium]|nr:sporulation protein YqfD [Oscillospiraceae bacterium]MDY3064233.1 sporulation protein YqfD [Oscillospiraceae bacterium]